MASPPMFGTHVELVVGGLTYTIETADVLKYPESFFTGFLKKEWRPADDKPLAIARDGTLFKYVYAFLVTGHLPRKADGSTSLDETVLSQLKEEADFYNLPALVEECNITSNLLAKVAAYSTIRSYLSTMKSTFRYGFRKAAFPTLSCEYASPNATDLVNVLAIVWRPFSVKGNIPMYEGNSVRCTPLFKTSTLAVPNVAELIEAAQQSAFGRGTETVTDANVRNSLEIHADQLHKLALTNISDHLSWYVQSFAPKMKLELRPYKLVIYQEGGHFDQHRDTVRGDNHIGTLVVILNSEYTGGELEISHGGKTEVVTGPYSWVAMYGDCLHKINPVTSGTRVSLIYDIYASAREPAPSMRSRNGYGRDSTDDAELARFLENQTEEQVPVATDNIKAVNASQQQMIYDAVDRELASSGTVVICLAHMYPACQSKPSFLKGGDLALYELLRDRYDVSVEPVSVFTSHYELQYARMHAAMLADIEAAKEKLKSAEVTDSLLPKPVKFVIPTHLDYDSVLDYSPYVEHTGNEAQAEEAVYVVVGLQVRKQ